MRLQPTTRTSARLLGSRVRRLFTKDKPVIFAFHGYPSLIHRLTYRRTNHDNLHVRGYKEEGTTTTPFDMVVLNELDRFHLAQDVLDRVPKLCRARRVLPPDMRDRLIEHKQYIEKRGEDLPTSATGTGRRHREATASRGARVGRPNPRRKETTCDVLILLLNAGSSSLKCTLVESAGSEIVARATADWAGTITHYDRRGPGDGHGLGAGLVQAPRRCRAAGPRRPRLRRARGRPRQSAIASSTVERSTISVRITSAVRSQIAALSELAPLHNPPGLETLAAAESMLPSVPQVAVFDTAFHATLPPAAYTYPLPHLWTTEWGIRRYGFHGLSHAYCAGRAAEMLSRPVEELRSVICHLGHGCSATAVLHGRSIDTTMGFTPLDGLMMATRSGSVDPGILTHVQLRHGLDAHAIEEALNRDAGLLGVSRLSADMREVLEAAREGDHSARLAVDIFAHRVRQAIGALAVTLGGVDVLVFTGGVGEQRGRGPRDDLPRHRLPRPRARARREHVVSTRCRCRPARQPRANPRDRGARRPRDARGRSAGDESLATIGARMEPRGDVYAIRHGETEWSRSGRHTSLTDLPLTESGRDAAKKLAPALSAIPFTLVLSSPLQRARVTCELAGLGDRMEIDPDLVEWNYGDYEGLTQAEIARRAPGWLLFTDGCPGGERPIKSRHASTA